MAQQPPGDYPPPGQGQIAQPNNHLVFAILTTLFCCLPLGIVSIVKASQVNGLWAQGRYGEAQQSARSAKNWAMWSAIIGIVVIAVYGILAASGAIAFDSGSSSSSTASSSSAASSSTSSAAASPSGAQPSDYSSLLIKPDDIGPDVASPHQPVSNPNGVPGVAQVFQNPDGSRIIGDTILVFADPAAAATGLENAKASIGSDVIGAPQPIDVGSNGTTIAGNSPDQSKAVTVVMFTEGRALVNLEFNSAPTDPVLPEVALDIARKQDAAVKNGLPS
jgi:hypothetical protein